METTHFLLPLLHRVLSSVSLDYITMQDHTDDAPIPMENAKKGPPRTSGTMIRKIAKNTFPSTENPSCLSQSSWLSSRRPPPEDEDSKVAKKPRLVTFAGTRNSTGAETEEDVVADVDASPNDKVAAAPTYSVTEASSSPNARADHRAHFGKWTAEEDAKLTKAVETFGKDWVAVAALVPERTNLQCRYRWLSTFDPTIGGTSACHKGNWTPEEDAKLIAAVEMLDKDWAAVAPLVPGRNSIQCRARWLNSLDPATTASRKGKWTVEEDAKLAEAAEKFGQDWVAVATLVPGRTNQQCRYRWLTTSSSLHPTDREAPASHKGKWAAEEDAKLAKAAEKFGQDWVAVAALVPGRTNVQCRYRFFTSLYGTTTSSKRRWTLEEDTKLIDAVGEYGEDWGEVAAMIPGRTNLQCRARWLSSFDPVTTDGGTDGGTEGGYKGKWTPEEDAKLNEAVEKLGKDWIAVAALVPDRTKRQCRSRWVANLDPATTAYKKGKWTQEEDVKLIQAVEKLGKNWVAVAELVLGRTNIQCRYRYFSSTLDTTLGKTTTSTRRKCRKWTEEEDTKLTEAVEKCGKEWTAAAALVPDRTNQQCRSRWVVHLDPAATRRSKHKWTSEEDIKLIQAVEKLGKKWVAVATRVPGRTEIQCRYRYFSRFDEVTAARKKCKWTPEEDAMLTEAAEKLGNDWLAIAALVPGRTNQQCRSRWVEHLDPATTACKKGKWKPEEDAMLDEAVVKFGKDWIAVAALIPGRTHQQCRFRWRKWTPEEDANLTEALEKLGKNWVAVAELVPGRTNIQCRTRWLNRLARNEGKEITGEDTIVDAEESSGKGRMCSTKSLAIDEGHERRHGHSSDRQSNGGL
jgi:hypothetical protein